MSVGAPPLAAVVSLSELTIGATADGALRIIATAVLYPQQFRTLRFAAAKVRFKMPGEFRFKVQISD